MWIIFIILWLVFIFIWNSIDEDLTLYWSECIDKWENSNTDIEKEYKTKIKRNYALWFILVIIWIILIFYK